MKASTRKTLYLIGLLIAVAALAALIVSIIIDNTRLMHIALGSNALLQVILWTILRGTKDSKKELTKEEQEKIQKENDDMTVINMNIHNM
ncbi:MAG: hypothetical protein IKD90_08660 [Clostridiales bacterium]|nr:hypothetical protein [Clostridiales bacterium]